VGGEGGLSTLVYLLSLNESLTICDGSDWLVDHWLNSKQKHTVNSLYFVRH